MPSPPQHRGSRAFGAAPALAHFFRFTAPDNAEARRLLARSRDLDPGFGEAHAWWAYATVLAMVYWDVDPSRRLLQEAFDATQRALDIDHQNAVFYALKARVQLARGEQALGWADQALEIPNCQYWALAHRVVALAHLGRGIEPCGGCRRLTITSSRGTADVLTTHMIRARPTK